VEIAIGDTRGKHIVLPYAMWSINRWMSCDYVEVQSNTPSSLVIQDFVIELVKIHNVHNVKIIIKCLYMKLYFLRLNLNDACISIYVIVCSNNVSDKFKYFMTYLHQNCIMNKFDVVNILRKIYDRNSNIEYELIAYTSDHIVCHALYEKNIK